MAMKFLEQDLSIGLDHRQYHIPGC